MGRFTTVRTTLLGAIIIGSLVIAPAAVGARSASPSVQAPSAPKPDRILKPDALISKGRTGTLVGGGIFNTTGVDQARSGSALPGKRVTFRIVLRNEGTIPGRLGVRAEGSVAGYGVKYLSGTTDVTSAVVAGTFFTGILAPGGTPEVLIAKVSVKASAAVGSSVTRLVTVSGAGRSQLTDAVQFAVSRK